MAGAAILGNGMDSHDSGSFWGTLSIHPRCAKTEGQTKSVPIRMSDGQTGCETTKLNYKTTSRKANCRIPPHQ